MVRASPAHGRVDLTIYLAVLCRTTTERQQAAEQLGLAQRVTEPPLHVRGGR
jgi:hypothetical protein